MRILVYGDSNSWGFPPDGSGVRFDVNTRWPCVMARELGATLIEDALPGRTTAHNDPELYGATMNGLRQLPAALLAHSPIDILIIMLGTNDCKARFKPSAGRIADNFGRLLDCVDATGGGIGPWDGADAPFVVIAVPPPLPEVVDHAEFERHGEWIGGRDASLGLARRIRGIADRPGVAVFDTGQVVSGAPDDPIHLGADSHKVLGRALAVWLQKLDDGPIIP